MSTDPEHLEARVDLAAALYQINPVRYASSILASTSAVLEVTPRSHRARKLAAMTHFALAQRAIETEKWVEATTSLRHSFELEPFDLTIEMFEFCAERTGRQRELLAACEERIRQHPADLRSTYVLGRLCVRLAEGNPDDREQLLLSAETALNRVLEFASSHVEAWFWLGKAFIAAGRDSDARNVVEMLRPISPGRGHELDVLLRDAQRNTASRSLESRREQG